MVMGTAHAENPLRLGRVVGSIVGCILRQCRISGGESKATLDVVEQLIEASHDARGNSR